MIPHLLVICGSLLFSQLLASSLAISVSHATHSIELPQIRGVRFTDASVQGEGVSCPSWSVVHEAVRATASHEDVFWVPHSLIVHNAERCGTGKADEYMLLVRRDTVATKQVAAERGLSAVWDALQANTPASNAYFNLKKFDPVYIGVELAADRVCAGRTMFARGSVFIFVSPPTADINFGIAYVRRSAVAMVAISAEYHLCVYSNQAAGGFRRPSPAPIKKIAPPPEHPFELSTASLPF